MFQTVMDHLVEEIAQRLNFDTIDDIARKRVDEHVAGLIDVDAARAEIEYGLVVQLPDRGPLPLFHPLLFTLSINDSIPG